MDAHAPPPVDSPLPARRWASVLGLLRFTTLALAAAGLATLALVQTGAGTELLARMFPPAPLRVGHFVPAHELPLPTSPFLEVGRRKDGSIDPELLEARYHAAGLTQAQALDIAQYLPSLSPVVVAVRDPDLEMQLRQEATQAATALHARYPHAFDALSEKPRRGQQFQTARWIDFQTALLLQGHTDRPEALPPPDPVPFHQARIDLFHAVERAGLRALRIAPANYTTPGTIKLLALRLDAANEALQKATGWKGGVLGLNGRVELRMGAPIGSSDQGHTQAARTMGRLRITGRHNTLAHEWIHALDFVLARQALAAPSHATLSDQDKWLRMEKSSAIVDAWSSSRRALERAAPHWMAARRAQAIKNTSLYWMSDSEEMAFAFQAHVARQSPMLALPNSLERYNILFPYAYPTPAELDRQDRIWPRLFARLPGHALVRVP